MASSNGPMVGFAARWIEKTRAAHGDSCGPESFTTHAGVTLPNAAAPCLSFEGFANAPRLRDAGPWSANWSPEQAQRFQTYRMIGTDGAGNPIVVDEPTDVVLLVDHENWSRRPQSVNSSVAQLAECLRAFLGEDDPARFRGKVLALDPPALAPGAFWDAEAQLLSAENPARNRPAPRPSPGLWSRLAGWFLPRNRS